MFQIDLSFVKVPEACNCIPFEEINADAFEIGWRATLQHECLLTNIDLSEHIRVFLPEEENC